jgi:hypothetical protein
VIYFRFTTFLIIFIVTADKALVALPKITPRASLTNYGFFSAASCVNLSTASFPNPPNCPAPPLMPPHTAPKSILLPTSLKQIFYSLDKLLNTDLPPSDTALPIA